MAHIPAQVSALLRDLTTRLPVMLGRNLVGVYLYGSLTQAASNPRRSDVEFIVVPKRDHRDPRVRRRGAWLEHAAESNPWTTGTQMIFLTQTQVLKMNARACHYQFGQLRRGGSDGNPIIWINVL